MSAREGVGIYVLVDGLGWEILRDRPFLPELLPVRRQVETILGYSSGAIPTLLTGLRPVEHGHWNLFYRSPETSPFGWTRHLARLPRHLRESRVARRLVRAVSHRVSGYTGYFTTYNLPVARMRFYDICETSDIYQPGGLAPARSLFDLLSAAQVPYECYSYHTHSDGQILARVEQSVGRSGAAIYFLYLAGLDALLHTRLGNGDAVEQGLAWYEEGLRRVHTAAKRRWGRVRMHVFSDHGMTRVSGTFDLMGVIEKLQLRIPEDYLPAYDSTMARFWLHSRRAAKQLPELLDRVSCGRLVGPAELESLGVLFPDGRYGDLVFVMKPGRIICPSDMGRVPPAGMHGFHPWEDPGAAAVYLSSEIPRQHVAHLTDVLPVLLGDARLPVPSTVASTAAARAARG